MKIHEHQAKELLADFGVPVPRGIVCTTADEVEAAANEIGPVVVVKAQVHAGGRGKGGGVKLAKTPAEAREIGDEIIDMTLVTHQTGPEGVHVKKVLVEPGCDIANELYIGIALDRAQGVPVLMACAEGGVEIEEVAARDPGAILKEAWGPARGLQRHQARGRAVGVGLTGKTVHKAVKMMQQLCRAYIALDCSLAEINPMVVTGAGDVLALDAKMDLDDSAMWRQKRAAAMADPAEEDDLEVRANAIGLSYIALDGSVGCMVNGAGLAMSTMDVIQHHGGSPANFLDVGGGADLERVTEAFRIILSDDKVKAILVNIFGGIMKCDVIAEGVVAAAREVGLSVPLVVRLEGTNVDRGRQILAESGIELTVAADMTDAAQKVVAAAGA